MIGGALFLQSRRDGDNGGSGPKRSKQSSGDTVTVACAPELMGVCGALASKGVKVFKDPVDLDNAVSAAPTIDAWLTYGPAPGMVNAGANNKVFGNGEVVASGRLAVVTSIERAAALEKDCKVSAITWKCLVQSAGVDWNRIDPALPGTVKIGVGNLSSALGTILVGPLALATADGPDPGIDEIDTKATGQVLSSVDQKPVEDELSDIVTIGLGAFSAVAAPEGAATRSAATTRGQGLGLQAFYPAPVATCSVVLSPPSGRAVPKAILDAVGQPAATRALLAAGWKAPSRAKSSGLPASDVLFALGRELS